MKEFQRPSGIENDARGFIAVFAAVREYPATAAPRASEFTCAC